MQTITTIGLDIAKSVFQVHGVDAGGKAVVRRQLKRRSVLAFFQKLAPCLVGIEACASSHHPRAKGNVRRLQATCYFTSARKLGIGSAPMSACFDTVAAAPGVPAATPRIGGTWRVSCAVY